MSDHDHDHDHIAYRVAQESQIHLRRAGGFIVDGTAADKVMSNFHTLSEPARALTPLDTLTDVAEDFPRRIDNLCNRLARISAKIAPMPPQPAPAHGAEAVAIDRPPTLQRIDMAHEQTRRELARLENLIEHFEATL